MISVSEPLYSEERAKDIAAEFRLQYPGLLRIFEGFRGVQHTLDREAIEEISLNLILEQRVPNDPLQWLGELEPDILLEILWRIGFLRAQAVGGIKGRARSGSTYVGAYQVASLNLAKIGRFQIHPMFRTWLGTREAES